MKVEFIQQDAFVLMLLDGEPYAIGGLIQVPWGKEVYVRVKKRAIPLSAVRAMVSFARQMVDAVVLEHDRVYAHIKLEEPEAAKFARHLGFRYDIRLDDCHRYVRRNSDVTRSRRWSSSRGRRDRIRN